MKNPLKITKKDLIEQLAIRSDLARPAVSRVLDAYACLVVERMQAGLTTHLPGLGDIAPHTLAARSGAVNGIVWTAPARVRPHLRPTAGLMRALNPATADSAPDTGGDA